MSTAGSDAISTSSLVAVGEALGVGALAQLKGLILTNDVLGEVRGQALAAAVCSGALPNLTTLLVERTHAVGT